MKSTMVTLLKFNCDDESCLFECWVNRNNNMLTHYNPDMSALLDWKCPECKEGSLRYAPSNARCEFELRKAPKEETLETAENESVDEAAVSGDQEAAG